MEELNKRLEEIIKPLINEAFYDGLDAGGVEYGDDGWIASVPDEAIDQIHEAFREAGYIQVPNITKSEDGWVDVFHAHRVRRDGIELMPGPEFLKRFRKEVKSALNREGVGSIVKSSMFELVDTAACRAAGVDTEV